VPNPDIWHRDDYPAPSRWKRYRAFVVSASLGWRMTWARLQEALVWLSWAPIKRFGVLVVCRKTFPTAIFSRCWVSTAAVGLCPLIVRL
jgi:hypothetical protein